MFSEQTGYTAFVSVPASTLARMLALVDLVVPLECGGCARPGTSWCPGCAAALAVPAVRVRPRVELAVPCWALGTYTGPRRNAVIAMKERGRRSMASPLGASLAGAIAHLRDAGEIDPPELSTLVLVGAPSRARAARIRGGDPVLRCIVAAAAALEPENVRVPRLLEMSARARDSVGLSAAQRRHNVSGRIHRVPPSARRSRGGGTASAEYTVLLVDDVVTTGATIAESISVLGSFGVPVAGALVIASA